MSWGHRRMTVKGAPCAACGGTARRANGQCADCKRANDLAAQRENRAVLRDAYHQKPRPIPPWKPPKMAAGLDLARLMAGK